MWSRSTDKAACVFFQVLLFYAVVMACQTLLDVYLWYNAYAPFGNDDNTSLYWCSSNWSTDINVTQTIFDMLTG